MAFSHTPRTTAGEVIGSLLVVCLFSAAWLAMSAFAIYIGSVVIFDKSNAVLSTIIISFLLLFIIVVSEALAESAIRPFTMPLRYSRSRLKAIQVLIGMLLFVLFLMSATGSAILSESPDRMIAGHSFPKYSELIAAATVAFTTRFMFWLPFRPMPDQIADIPEIPRTEVPG